MDWSHIASVAVGSSNGGNSATTAAINTTAANLLLAVLNTYRGATPASFSDSKGNTWVQLTFEDGVDLAGIVSIYYCVNPTSVGSGHTFTASGTGSFCALAVTAYSGSHTAPFNQENGNSNAGLTTIQPGSITTTEDNELVITGVGFNSPGDTVSINSGFTIRSQAAPTTSHCFGAAIAALVKTPAGAINPTWTAGAVNGGMAAVVASFKVSVDEGNHSQGMMGAAL